MTDQEAMRLALAEAQKAAEEGEIPVGAVLVRDGQVIAAAHNEREQLNDPTAHAEVLCLRRAAEKLGSWRMSGVTLYVTLEPCPMCAGAMVMSRVARCVYGAADAQAGCCGSVYDIPADPAFGGQATWTAGVEEADCTAVLQKFFQHRRGS